MFERRHCVVGWSQTNVILALKTSNFTNFITITDFIYDTSQHLSNIVRFLMQQLDEFKDHCYSKTHIVTIRNSYDNGTV